MHYVNQMIFAINNIFLKICEKAVRRMIQNLSLQDESQDSLLHHHHSQLPDFFLHLDQHM